MTESIVPKRRFRIVVALDLSEYAEIVLEHALDQAARHDSPDLHLMTVVDDARADLDDVKRRLAALVLPGLDGFDCADWQARLHVRGGKPHEEVVNLAAELRAHLIVIGRFGLHHPGTRLGSVASRVLDQATCPTLVVGMADDSADRQAQCESCVALRRQTDGERWFCTAHTAPDRNSLATTSLSGFKLTGGGLLW